MKLPSGRIEDLCADDAQRAIQDCRLERSEDKDKPNAGRLISTNGKALAVVEVELCDGDTDGPVSVPVIKLARKRSARLQKMPGALVLGSSAKVTTKAGIVEMPRSACGNGEFPDIDAVIPKKEDADVVLTIDAKLLYQLAEAIRGDRETYQHQVNLYIKTKKPKVKGPSTVESAIYVEPDIKNLEGFGVIMPCTKS